MLSKPIFLKRKLLRTMIFSPWDRLYVFDMDYVAPAEGLTEHAAWSREPSKPRTRPTR